MRTTFARQLPSRRGLGSWWGKAWQRAVEEAAYSEAELRPGRAAARRGDVGGITLDAGSLLAAVRDGDDAWTVQVAVPMFEPQARQALIEAVAASSGRIAQLLAGDLPHDLVEHAEESGAELLPFGAELATTCTCDHYLDPCRHGVAVLIQAGWLVDADPLVLFALRGLSREDLLAQVARIVSSGAPNREFGSTESRVVVGELADDVDLAVEAALRARTMLAAFDDERRLT
ncbi:MAG: SWIM zinc finger family protein [Nocardioidaceae bacterium]|nr:SWIM zinc finger family protein [Nocardioidaceae bacterium]